MRAITDPVANARIRWRSADDGGRQSGPPPGPRYAATAVFVLGDDAQLIPNWPAGGEHFSVLLEYIGSGDHGSEVVAKIDFLARDLAADHVRQGAQFVIMEGRRPVADALITEVFASPSDPAQTGRSA